MTLQRIRRQEKLREGFTLIEISVTLGILAVLFTVGLSFGLELYRNQTLDAERDNLVGILERARSETLNNLNESSHGVYVGPTNYTIFQGNDYNERSAAYDENFPRTGSLAISGATEVVFRSPDALVASLGTFSISNDSRTVSIYVNGEGTVAW